MNHTPGPWKARSGGGGFFEIDSTDGWICQLWSKHEEPFDNPKANANLIAAAPLMLEALKMAREELIFGGDWKTAQAKIGNAIAKAEGKS